MPLITLQFTGQLLITKNYLAENVNSAEFEKLYYKTMSHYGICSLPMLFIPVPKSQQHYPMSFLLTSSIYLRTHFTDSPAMLYVMGNEQP